MPRTHKFYHPHNRSNRMPVASGLHNMIRVPKLFSMFTIFKQNSCLTSLSLPYLGCRPGSPSEVDHVETLNIEHISVHLPLSQTTSRVKSNQISFHLFGRLSCASSSRIVLVFARLFVFLFSSLVI